MTHYPKKALVRELQYPLIFDLLGTRLGRHLRQPLEQLIGRRLAFISAALAGLLDEKPRLFGIVSFGLSALTFGRRDHWLCIYLAARSL